MNLLLNVLALKNLWKGAGSPYLQVLPQDYSVSGEYIKGFSGSEIDTKKKHGEAGRERQVSYPDTVKSHRNIDELGGVGWHEHIDDRSGIVYEEEATLLNVLIQELAHAYQTDTSRIPEDYGGPERYNTKGTREYRAHSVIAPFLKHIYENEFGIVPDLPQDMQRFQFAREYMENIE